MAAGRKPFDSAYQVAGRLSACHLTIAIAYVAALRSAARGHCDGEMVFASWRGRSKLSLLDSLLRLYFFVQFDGSNDDLDWRIDFKCLNFNCIMNI